MSPILEAALTGDEMNTALSKLRKFEEAKQKIALDERSLDPRNAFKVGDEINIYGLPDPKNDGLYKVEEVTELGVKYRKLRWHEKIIRRVREAAGAV
jgi:hypothetical protein